MKFIIMYQCVCVLNGISLVSPKERAFSQVAKSGLFCSEKAAQKEIDKNKVADVIFSIEKVEPE